ncbi:hypothetical protein BDW67DRAFT_189457 [Aspergillus spinulosporus]
MPHANQLNGATLRRGNGYQNDATDLYTLTRLSVPLPESQIFKLGILRRVANIPSVEWLNDGSWELMVRKKDLPTLQYAISQLFSRGYLVEHYDPLEPTRTGIDCLGLIEARKLAGIWFFTRALRIIKSKKGLAAAYYQSVLEKNDYSTRTLN